MMDDKYFVETSQTKRGQALNYVFMSEEFFTIWNHSIEPVTESKYKVGVAKRLRLLEEKYQISWDMIKKAINNYAKNEWNIITGNRKKPLSFLTPDVIVKWAKDRNYQPTNEISRILRNY